MKGLCPLLVVVFAATAVAGGITETFKFEPGWLVEGEQDGRTTVSYPGGAHFLPLGVPDLPGLVYSVSVPADCEATGITVLEIEETVLPGERAILPVQHPVAWSPDYPPQPFVEPDPRVYTVDRVFPEQPVELRGTKNKAGYRVVPFAVYPVRYNPVTRTVSFVTRLRIRVDYERSSRPVPPRTPLQNQVHGDQVRRLVLNPRDVGRFAPPARKSGEGSFLLPPGEFEHVIVTPSAWADSLERLVDWRTRQGWRSRVMPLESITAAYPGRDVPEQMRNFLKDADTTWGIIFAFIARDDYPTGSNQVRIARANNYNVKSDLYFSDLDGCWDRNNNNVFGEVADSVDGLADIYVGMITLTPGSGKLPNYLDKLFRYEFEPDTSVTWVTKSLLPNAEVQSHNHYNDSIANATPSPPWFDLKMYYQGGMVSPTPQGFCDSLNSGYGISSIIAHGNPNTIDMRGSVNSSMLNALTNSHRMNFGTFVCCHTGQWDQGSTNGDCIAENMVFHAPNGFVAACHNDHYGWKWCAEMFNYAIAYGAIGFRTPRQVTTGQALAYGKDYWNFTLDDSGKFRMEAFERNLFGEPAIPLWTDNPFTASVVRPGAVSVGSSIPVNVQVAGPGGAPVDSAMVCLVKGDETFARGWTNSSGQVTLLVSPLSPGMLHLTVTSANNIPHLDSIPVMAAGRFVTYLRSTACDSAGGNGDGIINPGETVRIRTWVKNYGTETAENVTGRLVTHASGITITDPDASFGNIAANDSAYDHDAWEIEVAPGLPNGYAIPCSVICRDANDSTWVSYATWYVGAPVLSYLSLAVVNPRGVLDPGGTEPLEITVRNTGLGHGYNVRGTVSSNDPRLTFPDSTGTWGTVMAGDTAVNSADRFIVSADPSIPKETVIACTLRLVADDGYESRHEFRIEIGEILATDPIPDNADPIIYWAYDDGDSGYVQAPVFDWLDVTTVGTRLPLYGDDETIRFDLPAEFGPFYFYGRRFTQLSICSNGFIAPGYTTRTSWSNIQIPTTNTATMLALMWDDLDPRYSGGVWWYHDEANRRLIIQYDSMPRYNSSIRDWHQLIIYDTTLAAPDRNSVFTYQYLTASNYGDATVGINDSLTGIGIQVVFKNDYHRASLPIVPGRAIKFTTEEPQVGVADSPKAVGLDRFALIVAPNPFLRTTTVRYNLARESEIQLRVYDAAGRAVRTLVSGREPAGSRFAVWDGNDDLGRRVAHGVYFVRLQTPGETVRVKTVLTR